MPVFEDLSKFYKHVHYFYVCSFPFTNGTVTIMASKTYLIEFWDEENVLFINDPTNNLNEFSVEIPDNKKTAVMSALDELVKLVDSKTKSLMITIDIKDSIPTVSTQSFKQWLRKGPFTVPLGPKPQDLMRVMQCGVYPTYFDHQHLICIPDSEHASFCVPICWYDTIISTLRKCNEMYACCFIKQAPLPHLE